MSSSLKVKIGLIGFGTVAQRHADVIARSQRFDLCAVASTAPVVDGPDCPVFAHHGELLAHESMVDAVAICTPPRTLPHRPTPTSSRGGVASLMR